MPIYAVLARHFMMRYVSGRVAEVASWDPGIALGLTRRNVVLGGPEIVVDSVAELAG